MASTCRPIERLIARFEPPGAEQMRPELRRAGRMAILAAPLVTPWLVPFAALYVAYDLYLSSAAMVGLVGWMVACMFSYRRTGDVVSTSRRLLGGLTVTGAVIALETGGIRAPVLTWMIGFPLLAVAGLGVREGVRWLLPLAALGIGLGLAHGLGWVPAGSGLPPPVDVTARSLGLPGASAMLLLVAMAHADTHRRMRQQLEHHRHATEQARVEAVEAHHDVRMVLETVSQPLLVAAPDGQLSGTFSASAAAILPGLIEGRRVWEAFREVSAEAGGWLELVWPTLSDPLFTADVAFAQLPEQLTLGSRIYRLSGRRLEQDGRLRGLVLALTDVSAEIEAEAAQRAQKELQRLTVRVIRDAGEVRAFMEEARTMVAALAGGLDRPTALRMAHTLKGNAALMGLTQLSEAAGEYESVLGRRDPTPEDLAPIQESFQQIESRVRTLLVHSAPEIDLSLADLDQLIARVRAGGTPSEVASTLESWKLEPAARRLERLADQAKQLALKLGKGAIRVEIDHQGVRTHRDLAPLWSGLAHVLRNAVDHGLEPTTERVRAGKDRRGTLRLETRPTPDGGLRITVSDDGRGIDFDALRARARARGMDVVGWSPTQLVFAAGLSSRATVTETSGRGVGTTALEAAVEALGGRVEVHTALGEGTTFEVHIPRSTEARERVEPDSSKQPAG